MKDYKKLARLKMEEEEAAKKLDQLPVESPGREKAWDMRSVVAKVQKTFASWQVLPSELPKEMTTTLVENLCTFRCKVCVSFEADTFDKFVGHRRRCQTPAQRGKLRCDPEDVLEARYM